MYCVSALFKFTAGKPCFIFFSHIWLSIAWSGTTTNYNCCTPISDGIHDSVANNMLMFN